MLEAFLLTFVAGVRLPREGFGGEARVVHNLNNSLQLPPKLSTIY